MDGDTVLAGAGDGVRWFWHDRISVNLDLAIAMKDTVKTQSGDRRLHFTYLSISNICVRFAISSCCLAQSKSPLLQPQWDFA